MSLRPERNLAPNKYHIFRGDKTVGSWSSPLAMAANCNNSNSNTCASLQLPRVTAAQTSRPTSRQPVPLQQEMTDVDFDDVEDHVKPVYLRESSIYRAYIKEKERLENEQLINFGYYPDQDRPLTSEKQQPLTPKWKVCEPNLNAWRENTIDSRNLYSVVVENFDSDDEYDESADDYDSYDDDDDDDVAFAPDSARSQAGTLDNPPGDITQFREKSYILESRATMRSPETAELKRFWAQTIKEYNRPTQNDDGPTPSYCAPKNSLVRQNSKEFLLTRDREVRVESVTRVPPHLRILPKILRGQFCRKQQCVGKQFCDVLGPETCTACIEFANRRVAGEVQKQAFPELDCTVTTLVAPMLSKCMLGADARGFRGGTRRSTRSRSRSFPTATSTGITRLPTIAERSRFGRAGVERGWEEKARRFSLNQPVRAPIFLL